MLREKILQSGIGEINLAEGPENGPRLLLLHGFTNRWQTYLPILPVLIGKYHVFAFDHRGHGKSGRIDGAYTAAAFYTDAETVMDHLAGPVFILGHSMGGSLGLHLAESRPALVRALVTGDTSLNLELHINVMNNRRNTKLFGLRRRMAGRPVDELMRRGLSEEQAQEMSVLDPHVMDFHAEGRVEEFFTNIDNVKFDTIRCPLLLTQADPEKGGLLPNEELGPVLSAHPEIKFARFDTGHGLEISQGINSPFFQAALRFFDQYSSI